MRSQGDARGPETSGDRELSRKQDANCSGVENRTNHGDQGKIETEQDEILNPQRETRNSKRWIYDSTGKLPLQLPQVRSCNTTVQVATWGGCYEVKERQEEIYRTYVCSGDETNSMMPCNSLVFVVLRLVCPEHAGQRESHCR